MSRTLCFLYGSIVYVLFLGTFTYAALFIGGLWVPRTIDSGLTGAGAEAVFVNVALLGLFAIQHTIMARPAFKAQITKIIPKPIERATFVLATCICFLLLFWQWRAMPDVVWSVESHGVKTAIWGVFVFGWLLVLYSTFLIDHFDLFGLRQVYMHLRGVTYTHPPFAQPRLYTIVRNPLMLGFVIAFWAIPTMTQGHLLFAAVASGYILVGIQLEERDLLAILGEDYRQYRACTPMLIPFLKPGGSAAPVTEQV